MGTPSSGSKAAARKPPWNCSHVCIGWPRCSSAGSWAPTRARWGQCTWKTISTSSLFASTGSGRPPVGNYSFAFWNRPSKCPQQPTKPSLAKTPSNSGVVVKWIALCSKWWNPSRCDWFCPPGGHWRPASSPLVFACLRCLTLPSAPSRQKLGPWFCRPVPGVFRVLAGKYFAVGCRPAHRFAPRML